MADTQDRRSEGKTNTNRQRVDRDEYKRLKLAGICVECKVTRVNNRAYCYGCSQRSVIQATRWHVRRLLEMHGIHIDEAIEMLKMSRPRSAEWRGTSDRLTEALEAARKQR